MVWCVKPPSLWCCVAAAPETYPLAHSLRHFLSPWTLNVLPAPLHDALSTSTILRVAKVLVHFRTTSLQKLCPIIKAYGTICLSLGLEKHPLCAYLSDLIENSHKESKSNIPIYLAIQLTDPQDQEIRHSLRALIILFPF